MKPSLFQFITKMIRINWKKKNSKQYLYSEKYIKLSAVFTLTFVNLGAKTSIEFLAVITKPFSETYVYVTLTSYISFR